MPTLRRAEPQAPGVLRALGRLRCLGRALPLQRAVPTDGRSFVRLPRYPFNRSVHWAEPDSSRQLRLGDAEFVVSSPNTAAAGTGSAFAFAGTAVTAASTADTREFTVSVSLAAAGYIADHVIQDQIVVPGALYIDAMLSTAQAALGAANMRLRGVQFLQPAFLPKDDAAATLTIRVAFKRVEEQVLSVRVALETDTLATATLEYTDAFAAPLSPPRAAQSLEAERSALLNVPPQPAAAFYASFAARGLHYGPSFALVDAVWSAERQCVARLKLTTAIASALSRHVLHPLATAAAEALLAARSPPAKWRNAAWCWPPDGAAARRGKRHGSYSRTAHSLSHRRRDGWRYRDMRRGPYRLRCAGGFVCACLTATVAGRVWTTNRGQHV